MDEEHILPTMEEWGVFPREAVAVALKAQEQGVARLQRSKQELYEHATAIIKRAREMTHVMMEQGLIAPAD